nr:RNA-directed DNA polymerase, eukaryota, reverse transcriptase zinc-binding domain protein [Tanacetum cinerariifolium]
MNDLDYNDSKKNDEGEESRTSKEEEGQMDLLDDFIEHVAKENVQSNSIKEDFKEEKNGTCFESDASDCQPSDEMNIMIEVGDALGYDVKGCKRSLTKMINGIAWLGEDPEVLLLCGIQMCSQKIGFGVTITTSLWKGNIILFDDINEVRCESKRFGSIFSTNDAAIFNNFTQEVGLIDLPIGGRMFTWMNKSGSKLSKLDRLGLNGMWKDMKIQKISRRINSKRKSQAIQGILHEGIWITDPSDIKLDFLNFYKEKFSFQDSSIIFPSMSNLKCRTDLDRANLDSLVMLDEIKSVDVMKPDIQNFMFRLFSSSSFPPGLHYALTDGLRANLFRGIKTNISNSNLYGVGVSSEKIEDMAAGTGCSASNIPLSGWKAYMLFLGGRLTLIKSVLGSLGATGDKRTITWIKWSNILASFKNKGKVLKSIHGSEAGIDLKGCKTNGLWARIVGTIFHFHSSGFVPFNSLRFKVEDGSMVHFWKDTWLGDTPLCHRFNRLYRLEKNPNCFIIDRILNGLWKWDWNRSIFGGRLQADLHKLLVDIGSLNIEVDSDCLVSSPSTDGFFLVCFTHKHIDNFMLSSSLPSISWCKIIPFKDKICMWRMLMNRIPHPLNLSSRGLDLDSILRPVCNEVVESNSHLFFSCVAASNIRGSSVDGVI